MPKIKAGRGRRGAMYRPARAQLLDTLVTHGSGEAQQDTSPPPALPSPQPLSPPSTASSTPSTPLFTPDIPARKHNNKSRDHIPRPPNAFILFRSSVKKAVDGGHGSIPDSRQADFKDLRNNCTVSIIAGINWRCLSEDEKAVWRREAETARKAHAKKYPGWKYHPDRRGKKQTRAASKQVEMKPTLRCEKVAKLLREGKEGDTLRRALNRKATRRRAVVPTSTPTPPKSIAKPACAYSGPRTRSRATNPPSLKSESNFSGADTPHQVSAHIPPAPPSPRLEYEVSPAPPCAEVLGVDDFVREEDIPLLVLSPPDDRLRRTTSPALLDPLVLGMPSELDTDMDLSAGFDATENIPYYGEENAWQVTFGMMAGHVDMSIGDAMDGRVCTPPLASGPNPRPWNENESENEDQELFDQWLVPETRSGHTL